MTRFLLRFLSLLVAVAVVVPAAAQTVDLPESFIFAGGTSFSYPEDGTVEVDEDFPDFAQVEFGNMVVYVAEFSIFEQANLTADSSLEDAAAWYIDALAESKFDPDMAEQTEVAGREALLYPYEYEGYDWALMLVRFEDGTFGALDAGNMDEDILLAMAASLQVGGEVAESNTGAISCTVRTDTANTIQLRVGPGENRTVFAFLPANTAFTPLGQTEADDGSLWFQLDRETVAPQSAASEAWVAVDDVETTGDCAAVRDASAPPIVPITAVQPAASSNDSGSTDNGSANTQGSIAPASGTWTITYGSTGKGSCLDDASFTYNINVDWSPAVVPVSYNGSSVTLGNSRLNEIQPGVFSGIYTLPNGNSLQFLLRPVSTTHLSGEAIVTGVVEGHTCSNSVQVNVTKN